MLSLALLVTKYNLDQGRAEKTGPNEMQRLKEGLITARRSTTPIIIVNVNSMTSAVDAKPCLLNILVSAVLK